MSKTTTDNQLSQPRRDRPSITLPSGDVLEPRARFAARLQISERTIARMKLPTTYIGLVAHHPVNESLNIIASRIKRPNQPRQRRA